MPGAEVVEDTRFETNQTVLAAYFVYRGYDLADTKWENGMCTFFFDEEDEGFAEDFGKFLRGKARVEPVQFNNAFGQVMAKVKESRAAEKKRRGLRDDQRLEDAADRPVGGG